MNIKKIDLAQAMHKVETTTGQKLSDVLNFNVLWEAIWIATVDRKNKGKVGKTIRKDKI